MAADKIDRRGESFERTKGDFIFLRRFVRLFRRLRVRGFSGGAGADGGSAGGGASSSWAARGSRANNIPQKK
jgi:hypothetical protein